MSVPEQKDAPRSPATGEAGDWGAQGELNHVVPPAQRVDLGQISDRCVAWQMVYI
ncbi:hypothetical protein TPA0907_46560 [Micromonospora humidisoli]|nr:hypothetical protein TPA0907_46560 [Micromonospora sp. AKA109]